MLRAILALAVSSLALAWPLASSASVDGTPFPSGSRAVAEDPGHITLRLRVHRGLWRKSLYIKLVKTKLIPFSICAIRDYQAGQKYDCDLDRGTRLPTGTLMRLEQNPVAKALSRDDSPGWGMLGMSSTERLGAVLSNTVTGDKYGTFRYRVTLRDLPGQILVASNTVTVVWHR